MRLVNAQVFYGDEFVKTDVHIEDGHIVSVGGEGGGEVMDLGGGYLIPGLIDVHTHGYGGVDVMDGAEAVLHMSAAYARLGVTTFLPTTMSATVEATASAVRGVRAAMGRERGAHILGVHMEGPMINPARKGAQEDRFMLAPSPDTLDALCGGDVSIIRLLTIAPELPGGRETVACARAHGITVSAGHTDASYEQMCEAVSWGVTHVTHLFNGMNALHHRKPGVPTAGLMLAELYPEVIADGVHIHPAVLSLIARVAGDRACLVTDSLMAAGLPDGEYTLGGQRVQVLQGQARLPGSDTLAGSTLTLDRAVRNMMELAAVTPEQAVRMATRNPARSLRLTDRGEIRPGMRADLCLLDAAYRPLATWVAGELVHREDVI